MTQERPNTISGLQAKRKELATLHRQLVAEAKKVLCDIDHLDAVIRIFDPAADIERIRLNRYATKHRARKGHLKRFVLSQLREASEPLTSRDITAAWIKDRGLAPDEATFVILRKRIGACLKTCEKQGLCEGAGVVDDDGPTGPLKLWRVRLP